MTFTIPALLEHDRPPAAKPVADGTAEGPPELEVLGTLETLAERAEEALAAQEAAQAIRLAEQELKDRFRRAHVLQNYFRDHLRTCVTLYEPTFELPAEPRLRFVVEPPCKPDGKVHVDLLAPCPGCGTPHRVASWPTLEQVGLVLRQLEAGDEALVCGDEECPRWS
jgi:hypothetical protein